MSECVQHGSWYLSGTVLSTTNSVSDGIPLRVTIRCGWCNVPVVFDRSSLVPGNGEPREGQRFVFLADLVLHLAAVHGVELDPFSETVTRETAEAAHAAAHEVGVVQ